MDPKLNGGHPPDANPPSSFVSTVSAAFAHITGKDKDQVVQPESTQNPAAETTASLAKPATEQAQESNLFSAYNTDSSADLDGAAKEGEAPPADEMKAEAEFEEPSFAEDAVEKLEEQDFEMKEEYESSIGAEDIAPSIPRQLQALVGDQTVKVKVKAGDEIVEDDLVVGGKEMERSLTSSTNTSEDQGETEEYPQEQEHHHRHRTRSSSFDIAQALVNTANNNSADQETNTTNSSFSNPPADFGDAALLLGLTGTAEQSTKPVRGELEPATLPSTMTFFLDMLNEDQRRVRHRHIPAVDGFRKLYKSEIKQDLAAARALNKKIKRGDDMMEVDEEMKDEMSENDVLGEFVPTKDETEQADALSDSNAFVAPSENTIAFAHCGQLASLMESTPFENSMRGGVSATTLRSPQLVESLTAYNPPRPQESTAAKTKSRLKRWESNPQDVEVDLLNYKKTVQRTRMELHKAENERIQIEAVTSLIRTQYMNHLDAYREEIAAIGEQLHGVRSKCFKAAEEYNGKTISTRGSSKTMKDIFATLKSLGDDLGAKATVDGDGKRSLHPDWRVSGLGGIASTKDGVASSDLLAEGWIIVGDQVKTPTGEVGTVVRCDGPSIKKDSKNKKDPAAKSKDSHAMDIDKPKKESEATSSQNMVFPAGITVRLANGTEKIFLPSDLELQSTTFLCGKDSNLVSRWENMKKSAIETGLHHDYCGMNTQVIASILRKQQEQENDGGASPKSVDQYDDLRNVIPFGSGIVSAPEDIRDFSSIIPVNALEDNVRRLVYESGNDVQIIPVMPTSVEKYESQRENLNKLKIKVLQLRNRLGRQKKIRSLNERNLKSGEKRAHKMEELLVEMQTDLTNLKGRLQEELNELGISKSNGVEEKESTDKISLPLESEVAVEHLKEEQPVSGTITEPADEKRRLDDADGDPETKRARVG